ncbi:MAG TPA: DUF2007 domain-containing protein [Pirellulales bacterium]|nr:DUF2007 domain-containing protein [Pirellulales bacterium]
MADPEELVTIYRAGSEAEGQLLRDLLADEGIDASIADENSVLAGLQISGADVYVHRRDQARAMELVADFERRQIERVEGEEDEDEDMSE